MNNQFGSPSMPQSFGQTQTAQAAGASPASQNLPPVNGASMGPFMGIKDLGYSKYTTPSGNNYVITRHSYDNGTGNGAGVFSEVLVPASAHGDKNYLADVQSDMQSRPEWKTGNIIPFYSGNNKNPPGYPGVMSGTDADFNNMYK